MRPTLTQARTPQDYDAVRALCWQYRDYLLGFGPTERRITTLFYPSETYESLMRELEHKHARPTGIALLARLGENQVGCGMSQPLSATASEIKRVFVTDTARGSGLGRRICEALIDQARADGFSTVYLDTSVNFTAARALYLSLGFVERGPYQDVPEAAAGAICFYELTL